MMPKAAVVVLLFFTALALGVPAVAEEEPLGAIFDDIRSVYGTMPGLTMAYEREVVTRSMTMLGAGAQGDLATGQLYFRPSQSLRLEQETPREELLVTDGETIWWYVPEEKTVHRYPAARFGQELRLLNDIFRGLVAVEERFKTTPGGRTPEGHVQVVLRPEPPWDEIDHVVISVNAAGEIRRVEIHNMLGSTTIFVLGAPEIREDFPEGWFGFEPPEGIRVIEDAGDAA